MVRRRATCRCRPSARAGPRRASQAAAHARVEVPAFAWWGIGQAVRPSTRWWFEIASEITQLRHGVCGSSSSRRRLRRSTSSLSPAPPLGLDQQSQDVRVLRVERRGDTSIWRRSRSHARRGPPFRRRSPAPPGRSPARRRGDLLLLRIGSGVAGCEPAIAGVAAGGCCSAGPKVRPGATAQPHASTTQHDANTQTGSDKPKHASQQRPQPRASHGNLERPCHPRGCFAWKDPPGFHREDELPHRQRERWRPRTPEFPTFPPSARKATGIEHQQQAHDDQGPAPKSLSLQAIWPVASTWRRRPCTLSKPHHHPPRSTRGFLRSPPPTPFAAQTEGQGLRTKADNVRFTRRIRERPGLLGRVDCSETRGSAMPIYEYVCEKDGERLNSSDRSQADSPVEDPKGLGRTFIACKSTFRRQGCQRVGRRRLDGRRVGGCCPCGRAAGACSRN